MPLVIDHDERRRFVCGIAARLIARGGLAGVSNRDVAAEAGCSTRVVSHYFKDKRELLLLTFRESSKASLEACEALLDSPHDLVDCLAGLLPLDAAGRQNWQVWLAFWGMVANDAEFLAEQVHRGEQVRGAVARMIATRKGAGPAADPDWAFAAESLVVVIVGIATQGTFDPAHWTPERQRAHLAAAIERFL